MSLLILVHRQALLPLLLLRPRRLGLFVRKKRVLWQETCCHFRGKRRQSKLVEVLCMGKHS